MPDGTAVVEAPATQARPPSVEKPADPKLAKEAYHKLRAKAEAQGDKKFGWSEIRRGDVKDWLRGPDSSNPQDKGGWLRQSDKADNAWNDDTPTRDYLANVQKRAVELAREGTERISSELGIPADQIANKTLVEIYAVADAKGWNVAEKNPAGDETRDYLRNAYEYAQELKAKSDESEIARSQVETETLDVALITGVEIPEVAHMMLEVLASGGDVPKKIQELGEAKIVTPAEGKSLTEQEAAQTALGYDLQIAGIQLEQQQIAELHHKARGKKQQELAKKYEDLGKRVDDLKEKRKKIPGPNQVQEFVKSLGVPDEAAGQNPLGALSKTIEHAIADKEFRRAFIEQLRGQIENGNLKDEDVNSFEKFLKSEAREKYIKEKAKFGVKVAGGIGLFMLLVAWISSKKGQGSMMG